MAVDMESPAELKRAQSSLIFLAVSLSLLSLDLALNFLRDVLGAASVHHLCKSIVLVNTQAHSNVVDCVDRKNSKYYNVVVQYTARFNAETIKNLLYSLNNGQIAKKKFNWRLAPEETSVMLTGFKHNAVTCIGGKTDIPVIFDEAIWAPLSSSALLNPSFSAVAPHNYVLSNQ